MSAEGSIFTRIVVKVKALLPGSWYSSAGAQFRRGTQAISDFAQEHNVTPKNILDDGVDLGRIAVEGAAKSQMSTVQRNQAEAVKAFTEAEERMIEIELKKRSMESDVARNESEARKAAAGALLAEVQAAEALFELMEKVTKAGMILQRAKGEIQILPKPPGFELPSSPSQLQLPPDHPPEEPPSLQRA